MSDRHIFFLLIYEIGDWSLSNRFISSDFFNNELDRMSREQRFKVKTYLNNVTLVPEDMSDGHISILRNRKKVYYKYNITNFP